MLTDLEESCRISPSFIFPAGLALFPVALVAQDAELLLPGRKKAIFAEGGRNPF